MRLLPLLGAFIIFLGAGGIRAQEPPLPTVESQDPEATASPSPGTPATSANPLLIAPLPLLPDTAPSAPPLPNTPTIPQLDEVFEKNPISATAQNLKNHRAWRDLRNRVKPDADVQRARAAAESARTDLEKRKLLGKYYELLYSRMIALADTPDLKTYLGQRKGEELNALAQPHVRPTPAASPTRPPTPTPSPSPTPSLSPTPVPPATLSPSPAPKGLIRSRTQLADRSRPS